METDTVIPIEDTILQKNMNVENIICGTYFVYRCETRTIIWRDRNSINVFEISVLRNLERIEWVDRVTNEEVLKVINENRTLFN